MPKLAAWAETLNEALRRVARTTSALYATRDAERILANASVYLEAFATSCSRGPGSAGTGGARQGGRVLRRQAPGMPLFLPLGVARTGPQFALLDSLDDTTLAMRDAWF